MSSPERGVPIGRGPRSLLGSLLAAGATCGSLLALSGLVEHGSWLTSSVVAVVLLAALTAAVRAVSRSAWLPSAVGLVAAFLAIVTQYGGPHAGTPVLPGPGAVARTWDLGGAGFQLIQDSMVPMPADRSAELVVVVAAVAVFLLVDVFALGADVPALAALPLFAFWLPAVFLAFPTNGWGLFWTGLCYLLLLALGSAPKVADAVRLRQTSTVVSAAVVTLVVALVAAPVVTSLPAWASVSLPALGNGPAGPLQLSDDLDLRDSLGARSGQTVLSYTVTTPKGVAAAQAQASAAATATASAGATPATGPDVRAGADSDSGTDSGTGSGTGSGTDSSDGGPGSAQSVAAAALVPSAAAVGPLRAFTLDQFDGRQWHRTADTTTPTTSVADARPLTPSGAQPLVIGDDDPHVLDVAVTVGNLEQSELPISTFPRTLDVAGAWRYDPSRDEVLGRSPTSDGLTYQMQVLVPDLTAADLRDAQVGTPPGPDDYLELPDTEHMADVRATARQIVGDATTPYAEAMALQTYLRSTANFTYDTRVPPARSTDAVWDFLQDRRGYCVQFATAMAVMARTLGIPTRVAVGFLPGEAVQQGDHVVYDVSGKLAHAWPELYFEGYGWVRFEPTPAQQTGVPPAWSDPYANQGSSTAAPNDDPGLSHQGSNPTSSAAAVTTPRVVALAVAGSGAWRPVGLAVVLLLAAGVAAFVVVRRRRRPVELTCERAWHQLRRALVRHASIGWSDATTPRAAVRTVQDQLAEQTGSGLAGDALEALTRLASAVEQERYAPWPTSPTSAQLHHWLATVRRGVEQKVSGRSRRGAGPSALPSGS